MEYRVVNKVRKEELKRTNILTTEHIYKQLIFKMINEMPMDALERVFSLEVTDYEDKETQAKYRTEEPWYRSKVDRLRAEECVEYKVRLKTSSREVQYKQEILNEPFHFNQLIELNKDRL